MIEHLISHGLAFLIIHVIVMYNYHLNVIKLVMDLGEKEKPILDIIKGIKNSKLSEVKNNVDSNIELLTNVTNITYLYVHRRAKFIALILTTVLVAIYFTAYYLIVN